MDPITLCLTIFGIMLALMVVRVPIAVAMFVAGTVGYLFQAGWMPYSNFLKTQTFSRFSNYDLSVIPLFLLMGGFATHGGLSRALFAFTNGLMSQVRGGMAMAAVIACAAFGAVCGSSVATAATVGSVLRGDLTERAAEAGLRSLFVGFETFSPANLRASNKKQNLSRDYAAVARRLSDLGIMINGSFVFGMGDDGEDVFEVYSKARGKGLNSIPYGQW